MVGKIRIELATELIPERPAPEAVSMHAGILVSPKRMIPRNRARPGADDIAALIENTATNGTFRFPEDDNCHETIVTRLLQRQPDRCKKP